ncbi:LacI family DNA-binding transcriptional regulator [Caballeronia sp. LZ034LL]|uniref:LacI family DNA-binding transcriptional regulator n=1 Tax=Caballeronia sp. LZ034LL TaxID=3038567 RepID=UPI00285CBEF2|nr:LacI family DNA-binding transcriptional regulator [Caballeronia sp. LZ034LL]MDR5835659.1 LacI family DNA-binding transcriptional regulator [Caballeronia sp. LZ034LL]
MSVDNPSSLVKRRARRGSGRVTLADVARAAGVAPMTASRALNSPETVNPEMVERVRLAVIETGYVPNLLAGALASARSLLVAVIVPSIASTIYLEFVQALRSALAKKGYQVILGESDYGHQLEPALLDTLIARRPDAIVTVGAVRSKEGRKRLLVSGIPVIETWDMPPEPLDMLVGFSQTAVGRGAAEFLIGEGRRHIAIISANDDRAAMRAQGFIAAIREHDKKARVESVLIPAPSTLGEGRRALADLLSRPASLDAVFCTSDMVALGVLTEAKARGIDVPEQLAVMGYGDMNFAPDTDPPLTTIRADGKIIGQEAARLIVERASKDVTERVVDVGFSVVRRASA